MVLTRSAAKRVLDRVQTNEKRTLPDNNTVKSVSPGADYAAHQVTRKKRRPRPQENGAGDRSERSTCSKSSGFLQLNLDVIFSVASQMHPMDLLSLTYTCKSLRYILMDKPASLVWRAARLQVGSLPDCPTDLSEQQYARLLFDDNCHGCENRAGKVYWKIHRRYCSACRVKRLRLLTSCENPICEGGILPTERLVIDSGQGYFYLSIQKRNDEWVDGDQLKVLRGKLHTTSDTAQLLNDMRERYRRTIRHADRCKAWEMMVTEGRSKSIIKRLRELGYQDEIKYQGLSGVKNFYESAFTSTKPFTDAEWVRMCPRWLEIMQEIRTLKLNKWLIQDRLGELEAEYDKWVQSPPSSVPTFDILPHVADVATFRPFDAIIKTPEPIKMDGRMFASALTELPACLQEWRRKVDAEIAALCGDSHCHLAPASTDVTNGQSPHHSGSSKADMYNLASIMFRPSTPHRTLCNYTELLFLPAFQSHKPSIYPDGFYSRRELYPWSTLDKHGRPAVRLCQEAPYVVRACGLDPAVATVDDMESRNARFICLMCNNARLVRSWMNAICHAELCHRRVPYDPSIQRWRLVSDEYIDLIESVECRGGLEPPRENYFRCLLCRPRVGDVWSRNETLHHLARSHNMKKSVAKRGVHYAPLRCIDIRSNSAASMVEMVEEEEHVTFRITA